MPPFFVQLLTWLLAAGWLLPPYWCCGTVCAESARAHVDADAIVAEDTAGDAADPARPTETAAVGRPAATDVLRQCVHCRSGHDGSERRGREARTSEGEPVGPHSCCRGEEVLPRMSSGNESSEGEMQSPRPSPYSAAFLSALFAPVPVANPLEPARSDAASTVPLRIVLRVWRI